MPGTTLAGRIRHRALLVLRRVQGAGDPVSLAQEVRQAYADWSTRNTGWMIDSLIRNFYSPIDGPPHEVTVVVGIDSALYIEHELRELRERVQEVAEDAGIDPVSIVVRTADSGIVITP